MKSINHFLLSLLFVLSGIHLEAQSNKYDWLKISEGDEDEGIVDLATDNNGNIYVVGFSRTGVTLSGKSYTCLSSEGFIYFYAKFDASANLLWLKHFGERNATKAFTPEKIKLDAQGNIYLFGLVKGQVNIAGAGNPYYIKNEGSESVEFLAKYKQNGEVYWGKVFEDGFYSGTRDFVVDAQGNSYLLGFRANVAKINSEGEEIFRTFLPNGFTPGAICINDDNIFIATSINGDYQFTINLADGSKIECEKIAAKEGYFYNTDLLVAALSKKDGSILWANLVRSYVGEEAKGIGVDNSGNVTLIGTCSGKAVFGPDGKEYLSNNYGQYESVPFIAQYNSYGKINWVKGLDTKDKHKGEGNYSVSLKVDPVLGTIYSTRSHCNDDFFWAVYYEKFNNAGTILEKEVFGYDEQYNANSGFYKSSCGTANFFVHIDPVANDLYLYGEAEYGFDPNKFGISQTFPSGKGTNFFIAKKSLGKSNNNPVNNVVNNPVQPKTRTSLWTGTWSSNWGNGENYTTYLTEKNGIVTGTYDYKNGIIKGSMIEKNGQSVLKGTWQQDNGAGWFNFTMSYDKKSFSGQWGYTDNQTAQGQWNGTKK